MGEDHQLFGACACAACAAGDRSALPRRRFLALGAAAGMAGAALGGAAPAFAQTTMTPDAALAALMAGNARYVAGGSTLLSESLQALRTSTLEKQEPFAGILSCADSRVPVELVFDESIGKLFVTRVAGNIATAEIIASLEYGAAVLGTKVIMVLAHQGCGAVKAAVGGGDEPGVITALYAPLHRAVADGHHDYETTAKLNAQYQAQILATASPVLAGLIGTGDLKVVAGYYALASGQVSLL